MEEIIYQWSLPSDRYKLVTLSDGLINSTFKVQFDGAESLLLQEINREVFKDAQALMTNYVKLQGHLIESNYPFKIAEWQRSKNGFLLEEFENRIFRLGQYLDKTITYHKVKDGEMAFIVGKAFGHYDKALLSMKPENLIETIPEFHHLHKYINRLKDTLAKADSKRIESARSELDMVDKYLYLLKQNFPKQRIIHNDAKISNLLFRENEVHAIIDWDTTMAGHISWEFADLVRTSTISVEEDHPAANEIDFRIEHFEGLSAGYKSVLFDQLDSNEQESFYNGTLYIIFEQAIRFLEDYLAGNKYYKCDYEEHNLIRARNQFIILNLLKVQKDEITHCFRKA